MVRQKDISESHLRAEIRNGRICLGGNRRLKIYGSLRCASGKRMKKENRVFFSSEKEARGNGYRPCGHCMPQAYRAWKSAMAPKKQVAE